MIVSCPTCSTRYTLSDSSLGNEGRKVRCAKCGHMWWQRPEAPPDIADDDLADAPTEIRPSRPPKPAKKTAKPATRKTRPYPDKRTTVGLGVLALVLAGIGAAGVLMREAVVHAWPPAALLYETVGLPVEPPGTGLELRNVHSEQAIEGGATVLIVEGQIVNVSEVARAVPALRATATGADHAPLQSWSMTASAEHLVPGAMAAFRHSQPDPGPAAEVTISFGGR